MNGELELVEDSSWVIGIPVTCVLSVGAPFVLRARMVRKKKIPHIIPGEPWMRLLKQYTNDLRNLSISIFTSFSVVVWPAEGRFLMEALLAK